MRKPFLILQLRPETEAADDEFAAILRKGGLMEATQGASGWTSSAARRSAA